MDRAQLKRSLWHNRRGEETEASRRYGWKREAILPLLFIVIGTATMVTTTLAFSRWSGAEHSTDAQSGNPDGTAILCAPAAPSTPAGRSARPAPFPGEPLARDQDELHTRRNL